MGTCMRKPSKVAERKVENVHLKHIPVSQGLQESWKEKKLLLKYGIQVPQKDILKEFKRTRIVSAEMNEMLHASYSSNADFIEKILTHTQASATQELYDVLSKAGQDYFVEYVKNPLLSQEDAIMHIGKLRNTIAKHYIYLSKKVETWYSSDDYEEYSHDVQIYPEDNDVPLEHYRDLFHVGIPPVRILVQGVSGTGKTVLLKNIAAHWGQAVTGDPKRYTRESETPGLTNFDLVLYLQFKFALDKTSSKNRTFYEMLGCLLGEQYSFLRQGDQVLIQNYVEQNPEKVLFLIDDIEYCPSSVQKSVNRLLDGNILKDSYCVITSKTSNIFGNENIHCLWKYQLQGLSEQQTSDYARHFAEQTMNVDSENKAVHEMLAAIGISPVNIFVEPVDSLSDNFVKLAPGLLRFPSFLNAKCKMWEHREKQPETFTQCYASFVNRILKKHQRRTQGLVADSSLVNHYRGELCLFGQIAFDLIQEGSIQITFKQDLLKENYHLTEGHFDLGLLIKTNILAEDEYVNFAKTHLVEYLAAFYLVNETKDKDGQTKEQELKDSCPDVETLFEYKRLFMCICGLSHLVGNRLLQWCVSEFSDTLYLHQIEQFTNFLLSCLSEYENKNLARFPMPKEVTCTVSEDSLSIQELFFGMKNRNGPEYGKVTVLSLNIHPTVKCTEKMITNLIHPLTSGPLKELSIHCGDSMTREAYQQLYNEVKFMKNLTRISLRLYRRHKDDHFFRSLLNKLSVLENLSTIDIKIEHPDIPAPLGQGGPSSPYASFCA